MEALTPWRRKDSKLINTFHDVAHTAAAEAVSPWKDSKLVDRHHEYAHEAAAAAVSPWRSADAVDNFRIYAHTAAAVVGFTNLLKNENAKKAAKASEATSNVKVEPQQHDASRTKKKPGPKPGSQHTCPNCGEKGHRGEFSYPITDSDTMLIASHTTVFRDGSGDCIRGAAGTTGYYAGPSC
jgi:hypothetical protein